LLFHLLGEASISANVLISMGNQCFYGCGVTDSGVSDPVFFRFTLLIGLFAS